MIFLTLLGPSISSVYKEKHYVDYTGRDGLQVIPEFHDVEAFSKFSDAVIKVCASVKFLLL